MLQHIYFSPLIESIRKGSIFMQMTMVIWGPRDASGGNPGLPRGNTGTGCPGVWPGGTTGVPWGWPRGDLGTGCPGVCPGGVPWMPWGDLGGNLVVTQGHSILGQPEGNPGVTEEQSILGVWPMGAPGMARGQPGDRLSWYLTGGSYKMKSNSNGGEAGAAIEPAVLQSFSHGDSHLYWSFSFICLRDIFTQSWNDYFSLDQNMFL